MKKSKLQKIAKAFVKGSNPLNALGCFLTSDGSAFYRNYSGLQFARAHERNPLNVLEFDENGEIVTPKDPDKERVELITKINDDPNNKYSSPQLANLSLDGLKKLASDINAEIDTSGTDEGGNESKEVNLNKMNREPLIELLSEVDPTIVVEKETKAQLRELILSANTLNDYTDGELIGMVKHFDPEMIGDEMNNEDVSKVMSNNDLKAIVLNLRDNVEIDGEITDKLFALDSSDGSDGSENDNSNEDNVED